MARGMENLPGLFVHMERKCNGKIEEDQDRREKIPV